MRVPYFANRSAGLHPGTNPRLLPATCRIGRSALRWRASPTETRVSKQGRPRLFKQFVWLKPGPGEAWPSAPERAKWASHAKTKLYFWRLSGFVSVAWLVVKAVRMKLSPFLRSSTRRRLGFWERRFARTLGSPERVVRVVWPPPVGVRVHPGASVANCRFRVQTDTKSATEAEAKRDGASNRWRGPARWSRCPPCGAARSRDRLWG